jgi:hypothetical protein
MQASQGLDLRKPVVTSYWQKKDPRLARILLWMESVEDWMLDEHPDVARALRDMSLSMPNIKSSFLADTAEEWLTVLAYMSSARSLRMVEWIDHARSAKSGALDLVQTARAIPHHDHAQLLIDRLQTLRTLDLLSKIFSPKRLDTVSMLLRRAQNQG